MWTISLVLAVVSSASVAVAQPPALSRAGVRAGHAMAAVSPRMFLNNAWAVGASYTAGLAGAEWLRVAGPRAGLALGAGATGVGARVLWYPSNRYDAMFWRSYVSAGAAYAAWSSGAAERGSTAVGAEVGVQHWYQETDWFLDAALGVAGAVRGEWFGRHTLPVARVTVGRGFWF